MTDTDVAARLAALTPEQRAALERLLAAEPATETVFPLSVFQEGLWFLEQLHSENVAYLGLSALRLTGTALDVGALQTALNRLVARHEVARTVFAVRDGKPVQVVLPSWEVTIPVEDLRGAGLDEAELTSRAVASVLGTPFDLEREPAFRLAVLHTGDQESLVVAAAHHIIFDRQAFGIMLAELSTDYEAVVRGETSDLRPPQVQYGDFSEWQRSLLGSPAWEEQLAYWRTELAGVPAVLEAPLDRPRPAVQSLRGGQLLVEIPVDVMDAVAAVGGRHQATPYMVLLTAFATVLHRWSGQDDVVVSCPASLRDRPETELMLGYFINPLPMRVRAGGRPTFGTLLDRVRDTCLGAYAHQDVPFDIVVADLQLPRELAFPALCQVSLTYGREPVPAQGFGGTLERMHLPSEGARFDLELQAFHREGALAGYLEYDSAIWDAATIERFFRQMVTVLTVGAQDEDLVVDDIELSSEEERRFLLETVNGTGQDWPSEQGWIHECFEARAAENPGAPALRFGDRTLTYAELDARSNRLAHHLRSRGVVRGDVVAVMMERSVTLVESLLAVLKAGAAYLPLATDLPQARLDAILTTSTPRFVLTQEALASQLDGSALEVLAVDALDDVLAAEPAESPAVPLTGSDAAYVIYTSGSTGTPKGVVNVHGGIRNRLLWMQDAFPLDGTDRVLQKTPYSFDVSVWEFFWPLMAGATLVVAPPGLHKDPTGLLDLVVAEEITTMHFVPSMLQLFVAGDLERGTSLRRVFSSGEALPRELADTFLRRSAAELHNLYGPTEAAVDVTHWPCSLDDPPGPVPIGRPIANTAVLVVDSEGRLAPLGVPGELLIGGDNLARGYLGQSELTRERFVPHPWSADDHARLYRTGDLARIDARGVVHFLGRLDHQVKLRGFRIELGEIEAALTSVPGVTAAAVTVHEVRPGDQRLVAFVTVTGDMGVSGLTAALRATLPEYMVPAHFVEVPAMPLTISGKIDRKALVPPDLGGPVQTAPYVPPVEGLEEMVAEVWCEVLGVERVGRDDNFFDLGGHSLLLAQVKTVLGERVGADIPMVDLFQHPTVALLAERLEQSGSVQAESETARQRGANRRAALQRRQGRAARRAATDER